MAETESSIKEAIQRLDGRVTKHGEEIDEITLKLNAMQVEEKHRDESMRRMEGKLDAQGGKMDALRQDMLAQTQGKSADKWEKAVWLVLAAVIGLALARLGL